MEYLIILLVLALAVFLLEKKYHIHLYNSRKERFIIVTIFFVFGVIWDTYAIWRGHWVYPPDKTVGNIGLMPIEDYLFMLVIPYFILTVYTIIHQKYNNPVNKLFKKIFKK